VTAKGDGLGAAYSEILAVAARQDRAIPGSGRALRDAAEDALRALLAAHRAAHRAASRAPSRRNTTQHNTTRGAGGRPAPPTRAGTREANPSRTQHNPPIHNPLD
jgi:predicted secreted protein